jgi:CubicO group peptidase (beta-lactamase class C family)
MRTFASTVAIALALLAGCSSPSHPGALAEPTPDAGDAAEAAPPGDDVALDDPPIDPRFAAFAQAFDAERAALGAPGAAVAILEHGQVTFAHGFGVKGPNSTSPVRARTLFRIGSMTKSLTTAALLHQVQAGRIDLAAAVTKYVPLAVDGPELATLTVKQLLTHDSGLRDYLVLNAPASQQDDSALASFLTGSGFRSVEYFMAPPGSMWNYANPNFYVAGLLAERAASTDYRDLLAGGVFLQLGMSRTFFHGNQVIADGDFANGKSKDETGKPWDVAPDAYDNAWGRPAGYAFSSVLDYAKFVQMLQNGDAAVLSPALRSEMQAPQIDTLEYGHSEHYGYGLFVYDGFHVGKDDWRATKLVSHGGDVPGFAADFWLVPSSGFAVIAFADADRAHFSSSIALALKTFGGLPAPSTAPDMTVDPATFDAFAGDYLDAHNVGPIHVEKQGSDLTISMLNLDTAMIPYDPKLVPSSPGNFLVAIQGMQTMLTFIPGPAGTTSPPAYLRTRPFVGVRLGASVKTPVRFDPAAFAQALRSAGPLPAPLRWRAGR